MDLGTGGLAVLHALEGRRKVVFADCAFMGEAPGTMRRFTPEQVRSRKVRARRSLHEGDLLGTLELAERLGRCPGEVVIFGVEPASTEPHPGLSPVLEARVGEYVEHVVAEAAR